MQVPHVTKSEIDRVVRALRATGFDVVLGKMLAAELTDPWHQTVAGITAHVLDDCWDIAQKQLPIGPLSHDGIEGLKDKPPYGNMAPHG